ncbi:MAG TPA: DMT family transporter [Chitinophaga sp.]|uniref:DMT family transporter n=1 Tax=Chitinophaga sp. TaxID=1869181 RepID=UPI002CC82225|nr:DMT family transporter [Chitinophaga sp.]HVI49246.1 DMT family transporter [Chitinophaga sp.]
MNKGKAVAFVAGGAVSFGILSTFVRLAQHDGYDIPSITFSQVLTGTVLVALLNLLPQQQWEGSRSFTLAEKGKVMLHGCCVGMISTFYFLSIRYGAASTSIVLLAQSVWMGILLECILTRSFPSALKAGAVVVILAGTILATGILHKGASISAAGVGFGLLAAVANTISVYCSGRIVVNKSPLRRTLWLSLGCLAAVSLVWGGTLWQHFDVEILWQWGWILAVAGMVLPPLLYVRGMPVIGVGLSSIVTCLQIPAAAVFAYLVLQEEVSGWQWVGIILITGAIVVMNTGLPGVKKNLAQIEKGY